MSDGAPPSVPDDAAPESAGSDLSPSLSQKAEEGASTPSGFSVWGGPLIVGLVYLAFWQIAPRLHTESVGAILVSTILGLSLIVWFNAQIARGFRKPSQFAISLLITAAIFLPMQVMVFFRQVVPPWTWLLLVKGLPDLIFVWMASSLGGLLSYLLRGANMIPPVAAVLALVDIWTVFLGPVGKLLSSNNPTAVKITQAMTVPLPAPKPSGSSPFPPTGVVGFADFLFIAFFVAAITRFVPSDRVYRRMVGVLIAVLSIYMLIVLFRDLHLPALLPLAVVMLALHWRHFQYSRSEMFAMLYAGLFILLIGAGFWFMNLHVVIPGKQALP